MLPILTDHFILRAIERFPYYCIKDLREIQKLVANGGCMLVKRKNNNHSQGVLKYKKELIKLTFASDDFTLISIWKIL